MTTTNDKAAPLTALSWVPETFGNLGKKQHEAAFAIQRELLDTFEQDLRASRGFDPRWGLLGRVRMLRGEIESRLGHKDRARQEYERVLAQWKSADPGMQEYVRMAKLGLAALEDGRAG